jgi:amidase
MTHQRIAAGRAVHVDVGAHISPEITVDPGETFILETMDCAFDRVRDDHGLDEEATPFAGRQVSNANPLAGPVFVRGVEPGDTVVVEIVDIAIRDWGFSGATPHGGGFFERSGWEDAQGPWATIIRHEPGPSGTLNDGWAVANVGREVRWPLQPFIGTLMLAPERGIEPAVTTQGPWGGNVDVRDIAAGNKVHLQATHTGGLLFAGDVHGSQGDSEFSGIANETAAVLTLRCHILRDHSFPGLMRIETPDSLIQVESIRMGGGGGVDTIQRAYRHMAEWLIGEHGMSQRETYLHLTANSGVRGRIYQAVNGYLVVGVEVPRSII